MSEESLAPSRLEERSRALFLESVDGLDMATRSRLTQARHAALAAHAARRPWILRTPVLTSALGMSAAAVLGVTLWFGGPPGSHGSMPADNQSTFEDLDLVASSDEGSGDAMEMLQDDLDFYAWADKAANPEPAA
ncbi:MAG TPA: hypothetical protein VK437_11790 [Steroidobacteraceae bacterium]|nr:hypothetical protein [Steroidobacteraceae bacterium]